MRPRSLDGSGLGGPARTSSVPGYSHRAGPQARIAIAGWPLVAIRVLPSQLRIPTILALALAASPASGQIYTRMNANGVVEATNVPDSIGFRLTYPGKGTLIHSRGFRRAYSGEFEHHIEAASRLHQLSPDLVKAVIAVESEFDQWAVSSKGAQGLMQLMPFTARRFGVADVFDARQNIFAGTQYLRILLDLFGGDVALALAAYNAGENAVRRHGGIPPYRETQRYVRKVQGLLGAGFAAAAPSSDAASFFVPTARLPVPPPRARRSARTQRLEPARPRVYYRWRDEGGRTHVGLTPPAEGTVYSMIRALDD